MIAYLIINSILLLKLILFILIKIFLLPSLFSKYLIILLFSIILYLCYKYPRQNILVRKDLYYYALKSTGAHIYNLFILTTYMSIFIFGIFYLRYLNIKKEMDLKYYYAMGKKFFLDFTWHEIFINSLIIALFIISYITIIYKLVAYFKLHVIKRHVYLVGNYNTQANWYNTLHQEYLWPILINPNIHNKIMGIIRTYYDKYYFSKQFKPKPNNYDSMSLEEQNAFHQKSPASPFAFTKKYYIDSFIDHLLTKWHYVLLLAGLLYDLKYNNFVLIHVFYLLPWTFFYELYLRVCRFGNEIWLPYDKALHTVIYSTELEKINQDTLLIDGEYYDLSFYQNMYKHYIARGFVKDPEHI